MISIDIPQSIADALATYAITRGMDTTEAAAHLLTTAMQVGDLDALLRALEAEALEAVYPGITTEATGDDVHEVTSLRTITRPGVEDAHQALIRVGDTVRHASGATAVVTATYTAVANERRWNEIAVDGGGTWSPKDVVRL